MSDYFDRIEQHLGDAVERRAAGARGWGRLRAGRRRRRSLAPAAAAAAGSRGRRHPSRHRGRPPRISLVPSPLRVALVPPAAVATATCVFVLMSLALLIGVRGLTSADRGSAAKPPTLYEQLAVLRRDQVDGDAPGSVVRRARAATLDAVAPFNGPVDVGAIRRIADTSVGYRAYLVPLRPSRDLAGAGGLAARTSQHDTALPGDDAAMVILTDAADRPVERPYKLTARQLRDAIWLIHRVRASKEVGDDAASRRIASLALQIVPDGIASVDYTFRTGVRRGETDPTRTVRTAADRNVVVTARLTTDRAWWSSPMSLEERDADGRVVRENTGRSYPTAMEVDPIDVCRGVRLPEHPTGRTSRRGQSVREACATAGLPARAAIGSDGYVIAEFPDGSQVVEYPYHTGDGVDRSWYPPSSQRQFTLMSQPLLDTALRIHPRRKGSVRPSP